MKAKTLWATVAVLAAATTGGCSSEANSAGPRPEILPPGMAQFTMNGRNAGTSESLNCAINGHLTTLEVVNAEYRVTAMVSNAENPRVEWVRIHDLNGFTGSYSQGLGGDARVTMTGGTYHIIGDAYGLNLGNPEPVTTAFGMNASC